MSWCSFRSSYWISLMIDMQLSIQLVCVDIHCRLSTASASRYGDTWGFVREMVSFAINSIFFSMNIPKREWLGNIGKLLWSKSKLHVCLLSLQGLMTCKTPGNPAIAWFSDSIFVFCWQRTYRQPKGYFLHSPSRPKSYNLLYSCDCTHDISAYMSCSYLQTKYLSPPFLL